MTQRPAPDKCCSVRYLASTSMAEKSLTYPCGLPARGRPGKEVARSSVREGMSAARCAVSSRLSAECAPTPASWPGILEIPRTPALSRALLCSSQDAGLSLLPARSPADDAGLSCLVSKRIKGRMHACARGLRSTPPCPLSFTPYRDSCLMPEEPCRRAVQSLLTQSRQARQGGAMATGAPPGAGRRSSWSSWSRTRLSGSDACWRQIGAIRWQLSLAETIQRAQSSGAGPALGTESAGGKLVRPGTARYLLAASRSLPDHARAVGWPAGRACELRARALTRRSAKSGGTRHRATSRKGATRSQARRTTAQGVVGPDQVGEHARRHPFQ